MKEEGTVDLPETNRVVEKHSIEEKEVIGQGRDAEPNPPHIDRDPGHPVESETTPQQTQNQKNQETDPPADPDEIGLLRYTVIETLTVENQK